MATSLPVEHNFLAPEVTRHATAPDLHKVALHEPKAFTKSIKSPRISDGETQALRHLAHSMVSRTLAHENEYSRMKCPDPSNGDWKLLKRQDALSIYKRRSSKCEQAHVQVPKRPMVLCVGSVPGTLEELLYGLHAKTREEMQATTPLMSRDYLDCALLAKLEEGSLRDPYRQLSLKWHLTGGIGDAKLARRRDLCVLESMGIATDAQGERYAYHLLKSVDFARCPPPPKDSGIVRASIMLCCIYRQRSGSHTLDMYAKGMFDLGGDVPALLLNTASCAMMLALPGAMSSAEAKRLTLLTMRKADSITASSTAYEELSVVDELDLEEFDLSLGRSIVAEATSAPSQTLARWMSKAKRRSRSKRQQACCVCAKKPSIVGHSHAACGVCLQSVCSKCRVKRRLVAQSQPVAITCCKLCLLEAKRLDVDPRDPCPMLPM